MKQFIYRYILYIYLKFIKDEDEDIYKNWAKPFIKIVNYIRAIYIWTFSIILFPILIFGIIFEDEIKEFEKHQEKIINIL